MNTISILLTSFCLYEAFCSKRTTSIWNKLNFLWKGLIAALANEGVRGLGHQVEEYGYPYTNMRMTGEMHVVWASELISGEKVWHFNYLCRQHSSFKSCNALDASRPYYFMRNKTFSGPYKAVIPSTCSSVIKNQEWSLSGLSVSLRSRDEITS